MSTQTKSKLYLLIIGILLVTNIAMLFFFMGNKDEGRRGGNRGNDRGAMMRDFFQEEIGFNDAQLQQYDTLSKQGKEKMKADMEALKNSKVEQFKELGAKGFSDAAIAAVINQSAEKQKMMELQMMNHFATIRKICTAEQLPKFDSSFYKIWSKKKKPGEKK